MRRTARLLTGTALAATVTLGATVTLTATAGIAVAAPAYAGGSQGAEGVEGAEGAAGRLDIRPSTVVPGGRAAVDTAACGAAGTASGDAGAVGAGPFTLAPGGDGGVTTGGFRVPPGAQPGTYEIVAVCAEGARRVTGDLVVTLAQAGQVYPRGSVKTGVGGALGPDPVRTAAGVAALAVAAAGGTWLLHRRARGDGM
ncbi:hypothetical protein [Streptomyces ziwulingensis]|uniref:Uncharacterized protein n=1 Tax=Streptomyces ziwulingensis TaxID=1045501 RepID=A0ABP9C7A6_9ACTN